MTNRRGRGKRRRRINYKMLYIRLGILILVILTLVMGISSCVSDRRRNVVVDASQPILMCSSLMSMHIPDRGWRRRPSRELSYTILRIPGVRRRRTEITSTAFSTVMRQRQAAILSWDWTEKSFSVFRPGRWPMRQMRGIRIRFRSSAATRTTAESLRMRHTDHLFS